MMILCPHCGYTFERLEPMSVDSHRRLIKSRSSAETVTDRRQRVIEWISAHTEDAATYEDAEYWSRPWIQEMYVHTSFGDFKVGGYSAKES